MLLFLLGVLMEKTITLGRFMKGMDPDMFKDPDDQRDKRQTFAALPSHEFNYTDEQIAICENDSSCLYDFAVTGIREAALTTLESGKNFTRVTLQLGKYNLIIYF